MNCSSKNLLRVITCQGCHEKFVCQIGNEVKKHITVHRQQSKDPSTRKIPLSEHLPVSNCSKTKDKYFSLFPCYKFPEDATEQNRLIKETEFINTYIPKLNS